MSQWGRGDAGGGVAQRVGLETGERREQRRRRRWWWHTDTFFFFYTGCPLSTRGADHRAAGVLSKTARVARREVEAAALEPRERARALLLMLLLLVVVGVGARRLVELNRTATEEYSVVSSVRVEW